MRIALNPRSPVPLYHQIAEAIRWKVALGEIRPGAKLPSTRQAATEWGVNRHTVRRAYQELVSGGLVECKRPGRMTIAAAGPTAGGGRDSVPNRVRGFVERMLRRARQEYGLTAAEVIDLIRQVSDIDVRPPPRLTVVECSARQCAVLRQQVATTWGVDAATFDLSDDGEPPAGPVAATLFHFEEIRRRWPGRYRDMRFLSTRVDGAVRDAAQRLLPRMKCRTVTLLAKHDRVGGENLAMVLADALDLQPRQIKTVVIDEELESPDALVERGLVLATPEACDHVASGVLRHPSLIEIRYVFDPFELDALGRALGWQRRSDRPAPRPEMIVVSAH